MENLLSKTPHSRPKGAYPIGRPAKSEQTVMERRERIVRAAISVFHRYGFHGATIKDICLEAGMTQSNLYNYVKSKQDLLLLICEHVVTLYQTALDEAISHSQDPHERLVAAIRAIISTIRENRGEVLLLYNEGHVLEKSDRKNVLTSIGRLISSVQSLLASYDGTGENCTVKNRRLAANFFSFVPTIVALRAWDLDGNADQEEMESSILIFTFAGLGIPFPLPSHTDGIRSGSVSQNPGGS